MTEERNLSFDFFIAHAGADRDMAEQLYDRLASSSVVFLDSKSLELGDDWDLKLREAHRASLITLILVSVNTDRAYYQREEIAAAIALAQSDKGHRVVPIYLSSEAASSDSVPYGLRLKHSATLSGSYGLGELTNTLLDLRDGLRKLASGREITACRLVVDQSYQQDQWYGEPTLAAGYSGIRSVLGESTLCTVHHAGYGSTSALEEIDVLVLPTPYRTFVPELDYREIVRWVQKGGGLLVLGVYLMEAHHRNNLNNLLRRLGIEFRHDLLMPTGCESFQQCMAQSFAYQDASLWIVGKWDAQPSGHPILSGLDAIAFTSSCSIECAERSELLVETAEPVAVLHAKGFKDPETGRMVRLTDYVLDGHHKAPFMAALRFGKGRVIGIGSWKIFLNEFIDNKSFSNARLLRNCVRWLNGA
jgi:hypothetical protein